MATGTHRVAQPWFVARCVSVPAGTSSPGSPSPAAATATSSTRTATSRTVPSDAATRRCSPPISTSTASASTSRRKSNANASSKPAAASPFGDPNQRQRTRANSLAAEYQAEIGRFALSASARTDSSDAFEDAFAYRLGASFGTNPRWFANIGRGVKNPTFTERFGFTPNTFIGNPDLEPETSTGYEAGIILTHAQTTVSLLYFDTTLDDEIDGFFFDVGRGGFTARNLDGKSRRKGAEATLETSLGRVGLSATYAYVDATAEDVRELRRPRHLGNIDARIECTASVSASLGVALSGASLDRDFSTWPATDVELDGYRLWRGKVDIALSPRWKLSLGAENLLDTDYVTVYEYRSPGLSGMAKVTFNP